MCKALGLILSTEKRSILTIFIGPIKKRKTGKLKLKMILSWVPIVHACNSSYLEGSGFEACPGK
jgi:hypothetical protein